MALIYNTILLMLKKYHLYNLIKGAFFEINLKKCLFLLNVFHKFATLKNVYKILCRHTKPEQNRI